MLALRTRFDGVTIHTPEQLRGAPPGDVIVVFEGSGGQPVTNPQARPSVFDAIGKAARPRTSQDIDAQVREEREAWGDR